MISLYLFSILYTFIFSLISGDFSLLFFNSSITISLCYHISNSKCSFSFLNFSFLQNPALFQWYPISFLSSKNIRMLLLLPTLSPVFFIVSFSCLFWSPYFESKALPIVRWCLAVQFYFRQRHWKLMKSFVGACQYRGARWSGCFLLLEDPKCILEISSSGLVNFIREEF